MSKHLYIGNLPHLCTESELRTFIERTGRSPVSVSIVPDRSTGRSRGFAFAEMASDEDGLEAIETLQGQTLGERAIRLGSAKSDRRIVPTERPGYDDYGPTPRPRGRRRR